MRVTARAPLPPGFAAAAVDFNPALLPEVRDPSLPYPIGRVVAIADRGGWLEIELDLDERLLRARLDEPRRPF